MSFTSPSSIPLSLPHRLTLSLFFLFTILHLFANYKAVRSVVMETFNEARLSIVLQQYLRDKQILSPLQANQREPVFLGKNREFADIFLSIVFLYPTLAALRHCCDILILCI